MVPVRNSTIVEELSAFNRSLIRTGCHLIRRCSWDCGQVFWPERGDQTLSLQAQQTSECAPISGSKRPRDADVLQKIMLKPKEGWPITSSTLNKRIDLILIRDGADMSADKKPKWIPPSPKRIRLERNGFDVEQGASPKKGSSRSIAVAIT